MLNEVKTMVTRLMQRPITEQIAMEVKSIEGFEHLEIENGEWVGFDRDEYMGGEEHGWIESLLIMHLTGWVLENKSGRVYPGDTDFVLIGTPDDIQFHRRPDVAYVRSERVVPTSGYVYVVPDLTVEIISPNEKPKAIRKKLREYLDNGVLQAWQVFPDEQEIVVNLPDGTSKTYRVGDTISGGDLLPGFSLDVATVFAE